MMALHISKWPIIIVLIALTVYFLRPSSRLPFHVDGTVDPQFERVKEVFTKNFQEGFEFVGASLAVYVKGRKVIDLWGGYSDKEALRKWKKDTISMIFSSSKGVGSLCVAMLVDRGLLSYDDLVTKYWPEFGQNGKDNITVQMLLSHQAGLVYFDEELTIEQAADHKAMSKIIEKQKPNFPPGSQTNYHVVSHGWLVDQLIRRVDTKKRGIGQFVREEFHDAHGIDVHIGLPKNDFHRVARLFKDSLVESFTDLIQNWRLLPGFINGLLFADPQFSLIHRGLDNVPWMEFTGRLVVNDPDTWFLEQAGALGIGNARALAKLYDLVLRGKIISEKTLQLLQKQVAGKNGGRTWLNGFMLNPNGRGGSKFDVGHGGHGCQQAHMDIENEIAFGYTTNGMQSFTPMKCAAWNRIRSAIYDVTEGKS